MSSVYVMLSCTFKYGREGMDVMGVAFRRDLFVVTRQVYPELQDKKQLTHTKVQQRLLQKLGNNAFPFFFEVRYLSSVRTLPRMLNKSIRILIVQYTLFWCFSFQTAYRVRWPCSLGPLMWGR